MLTGQPCSSEIVRSVYTACVTITVLPWASQTISAHAGFWRRVPTAQSLSGKVMNIVGVSAFFHDASCCVIHDGKLIAAAEEERFSRLKHDASIPKMAFRYCLNEAGLAISDIDALAFYEDPWRKSARQIWSLLADPALTPRLFEKIDPERPEREIRNVLGYEGPLEYVDHHHSHAASSYYFSGFEDAAILTVDGVGEWETSTYGKAEGSELTICDQICFPDSLGLLYTALTTYLGFAANDGEYKVMGLASYGKPAYVRQIEEIIQPDTQGKFSLNLRYFDFLSTDHMYTGDLCDLFGEPPRSRDAEVKDFHRDLACSLQRVLESTLLHQVRHLHKLFPSRNLCMAGGVALNCVANAFVLREGPFKKLFVPPAAGDGGGSIGAAAAIYSSRCRGVSRVQPMCHAYLGPAFHSRDIESLLKSAGFEAADYRGCDESELQFAVAERLAAGQIVGWFQGRMEYGPRALGSRSILADPRRPEMRDRINSMVKRREEFRPFAPSVLEDRASAHFDLDHPSPFMLEISQVRSSLPLPAITHVDGSARVQTVTLEQHPRYARLLLAFETLTGCPVLLNTSFNMRDEPIVCTPIDALICFLRSKLDALVMEDFVVDQSTCQSSFADVIERMKILHSVVSDRVYTLF